MKFVMILSLLLSVNAFSIVRPPGAPVPFLCGTNGLETVAGVLSRSVGEVCFGKLTGMNVQYVSIEIYKNNNTTKYVYKIDSEAVSGNGKAKAIKASIMGIMTSTTTLLKPVPAGLLSEKLNMTATLDPQKNNRIVSASGNLYNSQALNSGRTEFTVFSFSSVAVIQ